jgi:hypothetical protein
MTASTTTTQPTHNLAASASPDAARASAPLEPTVVPTMEATVMELLGDPVDVSDAHSAMLGQAVGVDSTIRQIRSRAKELQFRVAYMLEQLDEKGWRAQISRSGVAHWEGIHLDLYCSQLEAEIRGLYGSLRVAGRHLT